MASFNPEEENEQYGGAFSDTYSRDANGVVGSWQDAVANMDAQRYEQGARIVGYDSVGDVPMSVDDQRATRLALDEGNKTLSQQREEMSSELYPQNGEDSRSMYANYGAGGNGPQDWVSIALRKQKQDSLEAALSRRQAEYDHIMQIRESARARMEKMNQSKAIAAAAGLMSMYESQNGMSDASLSSSLSEAFGQEFFGFQKLRGLTGDEEQFNGNVALVVPKYQNGMKKDTTVAGMMNMETQLQTLQRAMLGTRTLPMQRELWGQLTQKYTPEQLEAKGLHNPDGPYVVCPTTLRGGTARRLGPERHGISAFSADGKGGFTKYRANDSTGWNLNQNDSGTRGHDYQGKWKILRSGGGQTVYENDKTGETVSVKDGETPPWLQSQFVGGDSKYRQAMDVQRLKNESNREVAEIGAKSRENVADKTYYDRAEIEKLKADAKREGQEALTQRLLANVKQRYVKAFMDKYMSADEAEKMADRILSGVSEESTGDGVEKQEGSGEESHEVRTEKPEPASPSPSQSTDNTPKRSFKEIKDNPHDGDELPLKGGKKARYNGKTKKWEEVK